MANTYIFKWESSGNLNDPSGVAIFTVGQQSVAVAMDSFSQATKLNGIIERACDLSKQQTIDRAIQGISSLLHEYRHD